MGSNTDRARAALSAMRDLGFPKKLTTEVLKELLSFHRNRWEPIEDGNYRLLVDAILNAQEKAINREMAENVPKKVTTKVDFDLTKDKLKIPLYPPNKLHSMEHTDPAKEKLLNLESSNQANLHILIPSPNSTTNSFILGPIPKSTKEANMTYSILTKTPLLFNQPSINVCSWHSDNSLRSWPVSNKLYTEWLERIEHHMGDLWRQIGIYDIIQMSRDFSLKPHPYLIGASLCFWSTASNSLHLRYGMTTPTLFDLAAIAGLRPDGCPVTAALEIDISLFSDKFKYSHDFTTFIEKFNGKEGLVQFEEHVAFLWFWICRFIACSPSLKIVHQYLGLAVCLAQGRMLALGQFVLGELYRSISDVILHLTSEEERYEFTNAGGPLWIYQIWLYGYFPEVVHLDKSLLPPSPPNYGSQLLHCQPKWDKLNVEGFVENFSFFYNLTIRPTEYLAPFAERLYGPSWFRSGTLHWSDSVAIWHQFLSSAGLYVGLSFQQNQGKAGVECYFPNCVARQFGLTQGVPFLWLYWVCHDYSKPFKSFDDIKRAEKVNAMLDEWYSHKAFTPSPCTTMEFDLWWKDYVKLTFVSRISDLKSRFLFPPKSQLPMKPRRSYDAGVLQILKRRKELLSAKIVKAARNSYSTRPDKIQAHTQPLKKKAKQSSSTSSSIPKIVPSTGDVSNNLAFVTRKERFPCSKTNQRETPDSNHTCLMDQIQNRCSSLCNVALDNPDIDSILRSIDVEPDEDGLLAFVNSLSPTANKRTYVESVETSSEIKAFLEELEIILSKDFTTVCQETALFERLKELVQFFISKEDHDFIGRGMFSALHDINQQIDHMQLELISACKSISEITEKQEQENVNKRDLLKVKRLLEDMEVQLHATEERRNELTALKLEHEKKIRETEEELADTVKKEACLSHTKRQAEERAENLTFIFSKFRKENLALNEKKAALKRICNDLNLKWLRLRISLKKYR